MGGDFWRFLGMLGGLFFIIGCVGFLSILWGGGSFGVVVGIVSMLLAWLFTKLSGQ